MHAHTFNLKSIRTLGIILTCGALAAGCAHNGAKTMSQETSPIASSTETTAPVASNETMPVEQNAVENTTPVANEPVSQPAETAPVVADNSANSTATPAIQQPGQMTFYFGFNKTSLDDQDKTVLKEHAEFLKANPSLVLEINGHTDHTGPHDYNEYLSKERAEAVAKILIAEGVTRSQLVIKALADDKPLADAAQPGKNRRVELQYDEMNMVSSK
ncbi:MAG: OmpA family protein [Gammaproteobacteria bacterium]|nr:OmpA family protein [Gammaproteobacteria bacterium]